MTLPFIRAAAELALRDPAWAAKDRWGGMVDVLTNNPAALPPIDVPFCNKTGLVISTTATGRAGMTYRCRVVVTQLNAASASLWKIRVEVGWTDDGAAQGAQGGALDHLIAVEVLRSEERL